MEFYQLDIGIHLFQIKFKVDLHWGFTKPSSMSSIQPRALCRKRGPSVISLWRCPTLAEIAASQLSPNQRTGSNSWRQRGQILPFYIVLWYNEEFFQKLQIQYFQRILSPSLLDCYQRRLSARGLQPPWELCHRRSQERPQGGHLHPILAYQLKL